MLVDYLKKSKIIGEYYVVLLVQLNDIIKAKCFHLTEKKVHYYSAPVHISLIAVAKLHELRFALVPHASYSPD